MKSLLMIFTICTLLSCQQNEGKVTVDNKNHTVETMLNRRSIRSYKPEQIKQEQLDTIINCAVNAPSARNYQPWEVRVIQNPELLKKINIGFNAYSKKLDPNNTKVDEAGYSIFYNAPTLVVVAKDASNPYADFDCGLLSQNVMLSAKSMGIGSVCLGYLSRYLAEEDAKDLVSEFKLPDTHKVLIVIGLGYPNETPDARPREAAKVQVIK